jgi:NAD(P)-dependent dehydrogenase (short-subunit alcohol dehydrogenase family)
MRLTYGPGTALITGGSGGIGSAVALALAEAGVPVALTYRRGREAADAVVAGMPDGASARTFSWEGPCAADAKTLLDDVVQAMGPIGFLVAASGIAQEKAFHALQEDEWRALIDTNLAAVVAVTRAAITPMLKAGAGRILLVGSVSGSRGIKGHTVYAATKAALAGLVRPLAQEAAPFGVTVNCLAPGFIDTPMLGDIPDRVRESWIRRIPMGRLGRPADVAQAAAFLLSEQAAYLTGQTWTIDGGLSL